MLNKYTGKQKIIDAIRRSGFKLIKNLQSKEYFLIEDYSQLQSNERLIK